MLVDHHHAVRASIDQTAQHLLMAGHGGRQRVALDGEPDDADQHLPVGLDRLRQIVLSTTLDRLDGHVEVVVAREYDHRHRRIDLGQTSIGLQAARIGKAEIGEEEIVAAGPQHRAGVSQVGGDVDVERGAPENRADQRQVVGVVLDDQNA